VSITTKKSTKTSNEAEEAATITEISDAVSVMKEEQTLLDKALQELEEPRPACIDTGMSYEERVGSPVVRAGDRYNVHGLGDWGSCVMRRRSAGVLS